jgi:curli production assembly/transport component CsgG
MKPRRAMLGPETATKKNLLNLPKPKDKIVTAVYKFRDQTGQYKTSEVGANWSTAVTQGATTILIRALEESGWFIPIERENMGNLLNERKVIRSSRAQFGTGNEDKLPPLLFAGVLLEGGIIAYESNLLTGGAGVRYFGLEGSGRYREDQVSIYIRAVSTANGKILKTVYTTKTILSQEISAGFFRYVKFKHLLEAETGFTYNEPSVICVTEAIEKAVEGLIIEGVNEELWELKNPNDTTSTAFINYKLEKENAYDSNFFGTSVKEDKRGLLSLGMSGGVQSYSGDYSSISGNPVGMFSLGLMLGKHFSLESEVKYGELKVINQPAYKNYTGSLGLNYTVLSRTKFTPYMRIGGGLTYNMGKYIGGSHKKYIPEINGTAGLEFLACKYIGIQASSNIGYLFTDVFDGSRAGLYNDFYWGVSIGMKLYILRGINK